jgi:hypothetical protein
MVVQPGGNPQPDLGRGDAMPRTDARADPPASPRGSCVAHRLHPRTRPESQILANAVDRASTLVRPRALRARPFGLRATRRRGADRPQGLLIERSSYGTRVGCVDRGSPGTHRYGRFPVSVRTGDTLLRPVDANFTMVTGEPPSSVSACACVDDSLSSIWTGLA